MNTSTAWDSGSITEVAECDRQFLMDQRRALLAQVDAIERRLGMDPTTADLRKQARSGKIDSEQ